MFVGSDVNGSPFPTMAALEIRPGQKGIFGARNQLLIITHSSKYYHRGIVTIMGHVVVSAAMVPEPDDDDRRCIELCS